MFFRRFDRLNDLRLYGKVPEPVEGPVYTRIYS